MTVQYEGGDNYRLMLPYEDLILSKVEIDMIQKFNFETMRETKSISELEEKNEDGQSTGPRGQIRHSRGRHHRRG